MFVLYLEYNQMKKTLTVPSGFYGLDITPIYTDRGNLGHRCLRYIVEKSDDNQMKKQKQ